MSSSESLAVAAAAASAPTNTPVQATLAMLVLGIAGTLYYASPSRLTRIMVAAIASAEKVYIDALESGALSATDVRDIDDMAEKMSSLHTKVSKIRETTLRNSLSRRAAFRQYLTGHTFTLVQCIWEIFGTMLSDNVFLLNLFVTESVPVFYENVSRFKIEVTFNGIVQVSTLRTVQGRLRINILIRV
ncbi:hypothetical protein GGX14DRAFT_393257 [Mycena pura]|uniref:Uncharacterized protein n=1 Tax=Mycena pura TaxID=153505 RepID=A0AAD6YDA6_9AGAR|nr:hypothetical protein GGX14DRAFT_393257 [Mycena pura]